MSSKWGTRKRRPVPDLRPQRESFMARILARSLVDPHTGCWGWLGHKNEIGYARMVWEGKEWNVSRLVIAANSGPFDENLDACHSCHNRGCVNNEHLRPDEHRENLMDGSRAKRLQGQWKTHCHRGHPLSGSNLGIYADGFRHCNACQVGRGRLKAGWPEELAFDMSIKVPSGYKMDRLTWKIVPVALRGRCSGNSIVG